jgi:hypothetical protein
MKKGKQMSTSMQFTKQSRIESIKRLNNSRNGNPRFSIALENGVAGKTQSDASFAYAICDGWQGNSALAEFKVTNAGNVIFTHLVLPDA